MRTPSKNSRFWFIYYPGMIALALLSAMRMKYKQTGQAFVPTTWTVFLTLTILYLGAGLLVFYLLKKAGKVPHAQMPKKVIPGLLIFYSGTYLIANISIAIGVFVWFLINSRPLNELLPHLFKYELGEAQGKLFRWLLFFTVVFFYVLWQKSTKKEQALEKEKLKFQYNNLKARVNPHFLFNSLNTISELVYQDAKKADGFIQKLSEVYRYVLENEETEFITLDKELDFVKNYLDLQQSRDENKIKIDIDIKKPEKYEVIPVSVQSLVENAVKHNASSKEAPLNISIAIKNDSVFVINNLQKKTILESSKTGLENLKQRVSLLLDKELMIEEDEKEFKVELPLKKV